MLSDTVTWGFLACSFPRARLIAWCRISVVCYATFTIFIDEVLRDRHGRPSHSGFHWRVCLGGAVTRRSHVTSDHSDHMSLLHVVPLAESVDREYYRLPVTGKFYPIELPVQLTRVWNTSRAPPPPALPPRLRPRASGRAPLAIALRPD
jgi:hypothetical protein